ncbi:HNH endonuclease [Pontiellaceae bacterium B1224]|nr:HNH endonuclease [Pontiellaceae bacterium B1224]
MILGEFGSEKTFWDQTEALYKKQKMKSCGLAKRCSNIGELKNSRIMKEFFSYCRCIFSDEYLLATDLEKFALTTRHFFSRGKLTEFHKSYHDQVMDFWRNTERYSQKFSQNGVFLPPHKNSLSDLKQNTLLLEYLYSPIKRGPHSFRRGNDRKSNPNLEHLLVTDGSNYLITNRYFFIAPEGSKEGVRLFWSEFRYSKKNSFLGDSKIVLRPAVDSWTSEYVIPTEFAVSNSTFYSKVHNWDEKRSEIDKTNRKRKALEEIIHEKYEKNDEERRREAQKKKNETLRQQRQHEEAQRIQKEKTARKNMPPPEYCTTCGESDWSLQEASPNLRSAVWECEYCGKTTRILSQDLRLQTPQRSPIPKKVQRDVWRRDQGRCVECGSKENIEFDHIIPVSKGGANTVRNIQLLCQDCNRTKSNKDPGES